MARTPPNKPVMLEREAAPVYTGDTPSWLVGNAGVFVAVVATVGTAGTAVRAGEGRKAMLEDGLPTWKPPAP